jgi:hypothetical protein
VLVVLSPFIFVTDTYVVPSLLNAGNFSLLQAEHAKSAVSHQEHIEDVHFILWLDAVGALLAQPIVFHIHHKFINLFRWLCIHRQDYLHQMPSGWFAARTGDLAKKQIADLDNSVIQPR